MKHDPSVVTFVIKKLFPNNVINNFNSTGPLPQTDIEDRPMASNNHTDQS